MQADREGAPISTVYLAEAAGTPPPMGNTTQPSVGEFHLSLACEPASVPQARTGLREWCKRVGISRDFLTDIQLVVTEAVANAVRHAGCDYFDVAASLTEKSLIVCVSDPGPGRYQADPGLGIGMQIIRKLAGSVAYQDTRPGTRVTMRFDRHACHGEG
jgi:anti-sigma regulatory factor (Ser/Thr protein kinase)